jgi:hypothetical protein
MVISTFFSRLKNILKSNKVSQNFQDFGLLVLNTTFNNIYHLHVKLLSGLLVEETRVPR